MRQTTAEQVAKLLIWSASGHRGGEPEILNGLTAAERAKVLRAANRLKGEAKRAAARGGRRRLGQQQGRVS